MAYSELVKNFNRIRDYMREFYVYGFKSREEYTRKSARSYDDERRRLESWLGDICSFIRLLMARTFSSQSTADCPNIIRFIKHGRQKALRTVILHCTLS